MITQGAFSLGYASDSVVVVAKGVGPGQLLAKYGVASNQKHRIVAYSAYIFKALGVQFQSPRHNSDAGSMRNAPWMITYTNCTPLSSIKKCSESLHSGQPESCSG